MQCVVECSHVFTIMVWAEATCADSREFSLIRNLYGEELNASICIFHQQQSARAEIFEINVCRILVYHYWVCVECVVLMCMECSVFYDVATNIWNKQLRRKTRNYALTTDFVYAVCGIHFEKRETTDPLLRVSIKEAVSVDIKRNINRETFRLSG